MPCFEEFKHSSSCIPKCNSFYLTFEVVLCHSWQFPSCFMIHMLSRMRYLNPSISLLELSCVIFHLKPSLRNVAIMVLINDPSFLLSYWWKKFFISLVLSIILVVSVVAEFCLYFEKFSISPLQAYSFRCWFSNNSVLTFLEGCFPSSFVAEVVIFFSVILFRRSIFYSFIPEALWCCSLRPIILFCQDHVIFPFLSI